MYQVDEKDAVAELPDAPRPSIGAPSPIALSQEGRVVLAYYLQETPNGSDGTRVRVIGPTGVSEPIALVLFERCYASMFGPPNDEAFQGHPLASRGLVPYRVFEVRESSWIRALERMNSVHEHHRPAEQLGWHAA